jgi:hypothetical protein
VSPRFFTTSVMVGSAISISFFLGTGKDRGAHVSARV